MTALDAYRDLLIELDKYESPSFSVRDFNYFWNSAVNEFVDKKLAVGPDVIQHSHDDLAVLLSDPTSLEFGEVETPQVLSAVQAYLPEFYRNILGLKIVLKFTVAAGKYAKDVKLTVYPRKQRSNREGYIRKNSYQDAKEEDAWYTLRGNIIELIIDSNTEVDTGTITFLKKPVAITLNPDIENLNIDDEDENPVLEFPDHTVSKIVKECRRIFLENIESPRYGTNFQEQNLRTN
jgi:hypothetical protein